MLTSYSYRHALDAALAGIPVKRHADHLEIVRHPAISTVLAVDETDASVSRDLSAQAELSPRFCGPGEWLVLASSLTPDRLETVLAQLLADRAHVSDQSGGRVVLQLSGPNARRILAKGVGRDLHPSTFPQGMSSQALCGHISVNLACCGENAFELVVMRSFAVSLYEDLMVMGREFSLSSGFSA